MKEAIGGSWLFTLIITLLAFFTCFISISTNYTRTYNIKDKIVSIVTNRRGINKTAITQINKELREIGYGGTGTCPNDSGCWYGFNKNNDNGISSYASEVHYCIKQNVVVSLRDDGTTSGAIGHPAQNYYSVAVFFDIDMPVVGEIFKLTVEGETSVINLPDDSLITNKSCIS